MLFMREFLAETALNLYFNLQKGSSEMIAMLYASKICMEAINTKTKTPWEFAEVRAQLKQQVAEAAGAGIMFTLVPEEIPGSLRRRW